MSSEEIDLIAQFVNIVVVALTGCGLFLIFLDLNDTPEPSGLRRRVTALWGTIAQNRSENVPVLAIATTMRAIDRFVFHWYEQSERNVATAGTFTLIVFVIIPLAALLNWFRGGSPMLLIILLACVAVMLILGILSEIGVGRTVAKIVSPVLFAGIFLFVPGYVFVSLTDRALTMTIGHGALVSVLLSPLLYLICHSAVLLTMGLSAMPVASRNATAVRRVLTLFLAALPIAYLATFGGLLIWHVLVPELPVPATWRTLLVGTCAAALSAGMAGYLVSPPGRRQMTLSSLLVRLAAGVAIGALLSVMVIVCAHAQSGGILVVELLPFAGPIGLVAVMALALCAKAVLALVQATLGNGPAAGRPYRIAGILALLLAAGTGWALVML